MSPEDKKLTKSERRLLIAVVLFVVIVAGSVFWWEQNNILPEIAIPTPVMPTPNAIDYYVKAGDQLGMASLRPPWASTHALSRSISHPVRWWNFLMVWHFQDDEEHGRVPINEGPTPTELHALLRAGAPGFATLKQGFQYECRIPPARHWGTYLQLAKYQAIQHALMVKANMQEGDDDWGGALDTALDGIQYGMTLPRGGPMICMTIGLECQPPMRDEAWRAIGHLTAAQARAGARRLEAIDARHVPFADVLQEEKWSMLASLPDFFHFPDWKNRIIQGNRNGPPTNKMQEWLENARLATINRREVFANYIRYMDTMIAIARRPYAVPKTPPVMPRDPINVCLTPTFPTVMHREFVYVTNQTQNACLETALALRAYRLEHCQYPANLPTLVPGYLKAIPDDPFALSGPLKYKCKGSGYVLYSIGPDGKDNGGTPSRDGTSNMTMNSMTETSAGDIVAGVNIR